MKTIGVDISDRCVELAKLYNPGIQFLREDIAQMSFPDKHFDGIVSYYSIINTPKKNVGRIFAEFNRILKPGGYLLVVVKKGLEEGFINEFLGIEAEIYFSLFSEIEIRKYYSINGFEVVFIESRNPYDFEIKNERIFAIGQKNIKTKINQL
jgi:ubiquinone/menaquinone biosynthesis C-methylase UbiE